MHSNFINVKKVIVNSSRILRVIVYNNSGKGRVNHWLQSLSKLEHKLIEKVMIDNKGEVGGSCQ